MEFTKPLQDVEVKEKESAKFECEVSRETAKVPKTVCFVCVCHIALFLDATFHSLFFQVKWFRDGSEIRKGKKYEIISKGVQRILIVHKSVFDDEAEYECDARTAKTTGILTVIGESGVHCLRDVCVCLPELNQSSFHIQRKTLGSPRTSPTWRAQRLIALK